MKFKSIAAAVAAASISSVAFAEGTYVALDYGTINTEISSDRFSGSYEADPSALTVAFGNQFNPNFAVEAQVGLGISEDEFEDSTLEIELSQMLSVNFIGLLPVNESFAFYGKAGLMKLEFEDSDNDKYDDTGVAYGVGGKLSISPAAAFKIEYSVLPDTQNDEYDLDIESKILKLGVEFAL